MNQRGPPAQKPPGPKPPKWSSPLWYLPIMLVLLWAWQSTFTQLTYRTIPYSEFKDHLKNGRVVECVVKTDTIEGRIQPAAEVVQTKPVSPRATNSTGAPQTRT